MPPERSTTKPRFGQFSIPGGLTPESSSRSDSSYPCNRERQLPSGGLTENGFLEMNERIRSLSLRPNDAISAPVGEGVSWADVAPSSVRTYDRRARRRRQKERETAEQTEHLWKSDPPATSRADKNMKWSTTPIDDNFHASLSHETPANTGEAGLIHDGFFSARRQTMDSSYV